MLTHIKDLDHEIMMKMEDESLLNFCKINNKYAKKLCNDENFWRNRTLKKFGVISKSENRTWKNLYLKIVYYMNKYSIFEIVSKLHKDRENYDTYNYFSKLVTDRIREVMLTELRMDYDGNGVPKIEQYNVISVNKDNIDRAVNRIYGDHVGYNDLGKLEHEPIIRTIENLTDDEVNFYRDYMYGELDEDLYNIFLSL
jgi:hypothetical protein